MDTFDIYSHVIERMDSGLTAYIYEAL